MPFCRPRFSRTRVELRHSMKHVGNTGFCFGLGKNAITDNHLREPPDLPGCGLAQGVF